MNKKADRIKRKLIKEVVIPSLLGALIALLFLLAVVKPTGASEDSTRPITGRVYFVSGRSVSSKAADDYIKSAVVSEVDCLPAEIEVGSEGALVHYASETYYLERK